MTAFVNASTAGAVYLYRIVSNCRVKTTAQPNVRDCFMFGRDNSETTVSREGGVACSRAPVVLRSMKLGELLLPPRKTKFRLLSYSRLCTRLCAAAFLLLLRARSFSPMLTLVLFATPSRQPFQPEPIKPVLCMVGPFSLSVSAFRSGALSTPTCHLRDFLARTAPTYYPPPSLPCPLRRFGPHRRCPAPQL